MFLIQRLIRRNILDFSIGVSKYSSRVPDLPDQTVDTRGFSSPVRIDKETIEHLERISLVDFGNEKGIEIVEEAIRFADQLSLVNTDNVEPLTTVLEDRTLSLREDTVTEGQCKSEILSNAKKTEESYFVAPPGNIPLERKEDKLEN